jgi:two-component system nitrate/nitrite response regulator NarL
MSSASPAPIRTLIADDHPVFLGAIADAVRARSNMDLVGVAGDGEDALRRIRALHPDVAVLDVRMPQLDGIQVLNAVSRDKVETRVLFCAASVEPSLIYDCMAAGACGYLDKGAAAKEICDAISTVAGGGIVLSERVGEGVVQEIRLRGQTPRVTLTRRELEVLRHLAAGLSAPQIAKELVVETCTVKSHLKNLYEKLGVSDRAAAAAEGMRRGLVE